MHWVSASPPPFLKNTTPSFLRSPHLKSENCQSSIGFLQTPPKNQIFQWTPKILKSFILNPSYLFKKTKFLVKISQFEFLVMTKKNISVYKLFLPLNISDFSLFVCFFFVCVCENCNPPPFPSPSLNYPPLFLHPTPPSQNWGPVKPLLFEKGVGGGVHTM